MTTSSKVSYEEVTGALTNGVRVKVRRGTYGGMVGLVTIDHIPQNLLTIQLDHGPLIVTLRENVLVQGV